MTRRLESILVVRTDRIGDLLMNVPLLRRLRQNHPKSSITVLAHESSAAVLSRQPDIDEVIRMGNRIEVLRLIRKRRFDAIVVSNPNKLFHFIGWALRIPVRVGYARKWGVLLNRPVADRKATGDRHEIDYNLELADTLCPEKWDGRIDLGIASDAAYVGGVLRRFDLESESRKVAVHVSTSDPRKTWPLARFKEVIQGLLKDKQTEVVLVGADLSTAARVELGVPAPRVIDLTGKTSLAELAAILSQAALLISLDSGPYHIAWMQKTPVVGLFVKGAGGSNPVRWGAYPGFANAIQICKKADEIEPKEVIEAANAILRSPKAAQGSRVTP